MDIRLRTKRVVYPGTIPPNGRMRVYACTLVDDDPAYDQGATLREALATRVMMRHHRCYSCFAYGASCSETKGH